LLIADIWKSAQDIELIFVFVNLVMKKILAFFLTIVVASCLHAQSAPEGLFIDSHAPDFKAKDQYGADVRLKDILKKGKVVLLFYRGNWSIECNKLLKKLADSAQLITAKGATLIAVTPEKTEGINKTILKTKAEFSFISDDDLKIMKAYDVAFEIPENTLTRYRNSGLDVEGNNGTNGKWLPVPAIYIIDKESTVTYRFFEADYKKRPNVKEILSNL